MLIVAVQKKHLLQALHTGLVVLSQDSTVKMLHCHFQIRDKTESAFLGSVEQPVLLCKQASCDLLVAA